MHPRLHGLSTRIPSLAVALLCVLPLGLRGSKDRTTIRVRVRGFGNL